MNNNYVTKMVKTAQILSTMRGRTWLMSNGKELYVAETEDIMESKRDVWNFWVAAIYENGWKVEA